MENYPDLGQVSMNLFSVFSSISPGLWQALMGFMYVQVAQQHRDIMREILGTRSKKNVQESQPTMCSGNGSFSKYIYIYICIIRLIYISTRFYKLIYNLIIYLKDIHILYLPKNIYKVHPQMKLNLFSLV